MNEYNYMQITQLVVLDIFAVHVNLAVTLYKLSCTLVYFGRAHLSIVLSLRKVTLYKSCALCHCLRLHVITFKLTPLKKKKKKTVIVPLASGRRNEKEREEK